MLTETSIMVCIFILAFLLGCFVMAICVHRKKPLQKEVEAELVIARSEGESPQVFFRGTEEVFRKRSGDHIYVEIVYIDR